MKYLFLVLGPICVGLLIGCAIGCPLRTQTMEPDSNITENLHLFLDFYPEYIEDYEVEDIAHHYMTGEDDPDAYGHILVDFDKVEVPIYVYVDKKGELYWYKWSPSDGIEVKTYLTPEQLRHVWSFD
jgi:hypothetical protein